MNGRFNIGNQHALKHGLAKTPTYRSWDCMKQRCGNPNNPSYEYYGGRGVKVCKRWRDSFANFLADMGLKPPGFSLDRIDSNGDYEPGNCRWATHQQQTRNRRPNRGWRKKRKALAVEA